MTCSTFEICDILIPGTGGFFPAADENWDSLASLALEPVTVYGSWRYAFDPVHGAVFVTGIFDRTQYDEPRPNRYIFAVEFRINEYRPRFKNEAYDWIAWSSERLALQGENGWFRIFADGAEVWSST